MEKREVLFKNNTPEINFSNLKSRKYSISIKYFDDSTTNYKQINYDTEIFITPNKNSYLLDISKENIYFNQHEPDSISERISVGFTKIIYPIKVEINEIAAYLGIENFNDILNRWNKNKSQIIERYNTKAFQSFYESFEKKLENQLLFEKSLNYDWFFNLFFHPKYIDYGNENSVKTELFLAVIPYEYPLQFTGNQKINTEITDYNSIKIHFESDEIEAHNYFIPKEIDSKSNVYMRLNVYYDLDPHHFFSTHTRAYFEVYSKDNKGKENIIKQIKFTQYQIDTENK